MKLVRCNKCLDIVNLRFESLSCRCGLSGGYYKDERNAIYWGPATPMGFNLDSYRDAIKNQPSHGIGERFEAFVIPKECPTMKKIRTPRKRK